MKKWITFLMTLAVGSASYVGAHAWSSSSEVNFEAGYRHDDVRWRGTLFGTAFSDAEQPDVSTTTHFKDIDIFQIGVCAKTTLGCNLYLRASGYFGWILDGEFNQHIAIEQEELFSEEFALTSNLEGSDSLDGRYVYDADIAIGYSFYFCDCNFSFSPVVGYAFDGQSFKVEDTDAVSFILDEKEDEENDTVLFAQFNGDCCTTKLVNRWYGPFIGFDFNYNPMDCWSFFGKLEYHWLHNSIRRHADEGNQGEFFNEFHHIADHAHGWVFKIGGDYEFCDCWTAGINVTYKDFHAHKRRDNENFFITFNPDTTGGESDSESESFSYNSISTKSNFRTWAVNVEVGRKF